MPGKVCRGRHRSCTPSRPELSRLIRPTPYLETADLETAGLGTAGLGTAGLETAALGQAGLAPAAATAAGRGATASLARIGHSYLEGNPAPISLETVQQIVCNTGQLRLHQEGWQVIADHGRFWLQPPATIDPDQALIALQSKNPLMLGLQQGAAVR